MALNVSEKTASVGKALIFAVFLLVWLAICAKLLTRELMKPSTLEIAVVASILLAPFLLSRIARLPIYLLGAYAALVPFDELLSMAGVGASLTKVLAIIVGASLVLSMIAMRRAVPPSGSLAIWTLLTIYLGATTFWAIDPALATTSFVTFFEYFLLLAMMALYPISRRDLQFVLLCMIAGALVAAGWGTYVFHSNMSFDSSRLLLGTANEQNSIDPNEFATGLLMPISLVLMLFLSAQRLYAKVIWLCALAVLLTGFAVSGSRGATIGIAAIGLYMFWRSRYRLQLVAIISAAVLAIVVSPVGHRFAEGDIATGDGRLDIWKVGVASLHQYWLSGAGIGNFNLAFEQYFLTTHHQPLAWDRAAHSIFVQSAVEYGLFGFILAMAVWFFAIRELHYVRGDERVRNVCIALSAGVLGLFVSGLSLDLMIYKYTWLVFALIALMRSMLVTTGVPIAKPVPQRSTLPVEQQRLGGPAI